MKVTGFSLIQWQIYQGVELFLLPKFDNSSPFVTTDKEICHVIWDNDVTTSRGGVPNKWGLPAVQIWCF